MEGGEGGGGGGGMVLVEEGIGGEDEAQKGKSGRCYTFDKQWKKNRLPGRTNTLSQRSTGHSLLDLRVLLLLLTARLLLLLLLLLTPLLLTRPLCRSTLADDDVGVVEVRSSSTGTHSRVECSGNRANRFIPNIVK